MNIILTGSSGSGLLSAGEILLESLMKMGYAVVAEREYPSLIKGGCTLFRIEVSNTPVQGIHQFADIIVAFDRTGSMQALQYIRDGGLLIFGDEYHSVVPGFLDVVKEKHLSTIYIPEFAVPKKFGANELLSNMLSLGVLWKVLDLPLDTLKHSVEKRFAKKPAILALDLSLIQHGYELQDAVISNDEGRMTNDRNVPVIAREEGVSLTPSEAIHGSPQASQARLRDDGNQKLLDGNEILALSAIHHDVRAYFAYPMSPASTMLTYLANWSDKTGMRVEQVEDEISAVQMALGANFGGTRSLVATSGGGFDLMTETVSLAGMTETPLVVIIAQRPGPATGMPTFSGDEDLNLAIYAGHGEYPKVVIAAGDHEEAFTRLGEALNIAEQYQIPVLFLTDKTLAETKIALDESTLQGAPIVRNIARKSDIDFEKLTSADRYKLTENGVSPRWLPGEGPIYYANGDEHHADGTVAEDVAGANESHEKRKRKMQTIKEAIPEPELLGNPDANITLVGWGSVAMEVRDFLPGMKNEKGKMKNDDCEILPGQGDEKCLKRHFEGGVSGKEKYNEIGNFNYLHYSYLFPLKTETIKKLQARGNRIIVVEHNMTGQLANHLKAEGIRIDEEWNKYDGRRFYQEEIACKIQKITTIQSRGLFQFLSSISMQKKYLAIVILCIVAIVNAAYLSYTAYQLLHGAQLSSFCDINNTFSCTNVIIHPDTMFLGLPFPYIALAVYPILTLLAIWGLVAKSAKPAKIIFWLALAGMCFNFYTIGKEYLYVHAYCILCLICTAIIITIGGISWTMRGK